jgi:ketopantoate hydroxymethyltransferase
MSDDFLPATSTGMVQLDELTDEETGAFLSSATAVITCTVYDRARNAIAGAAALPMTYVASSSGRFIGRVPHTAATKIGEIVEVEATVVHTDGRQMVFVKKVPVLKYPGE